MSENTRAPRASDTREATKKKLVWSPGSNLPTPDPRDGLEYRYVRVSARGHIDNVNYSKAMRDYWTPVKASEYPELKVMSDRNSDFPDGIIVGGLVLCCRDTEIGDQIRAYGDQELKEQMESVNQSYFKEDSKSMKKFSESSTRVNSFSDG
jgi:hypothetical protein